MKTFLPTLCFLLNFFCAFAQYSKIDSLQKLLHAQKDDTNKINILNLLGRESELAGDFDKGINYFQMALALASQIEAKTGQSPAVKRGISKAYNDLGNCNMYKGNYPNALKNYFAALKIREELGYKKGIAITLGNIGNIFINQGDYPKALDYYLKTLKMAEELGNKDGIATMVSNIGAVYFEQKDKPKALEYDFKALKMAEALGNKQLEANTLVNIGIVYKEQKDYPKALEYDFKALKIDEELGNKDAIAINLTNIGSLCTATGKFKQAEKYLLRAASIDDSIKSLNDYSQCEQSLSQLYDTTARYYLAFLHYKKYITARDTVFSQESKKKSIRTEMNFEFDKKEAATKAEQEKKDAVAVAESRKQKIILYSVIGGLGIVLLFALFIYRSLLKIRKKNIEITHQKKVIEEKQKEILDSIHYAKRIQDAILPREYYIEKTLRRLKKQSPLP